LHVSLRVRGAAKDGAWTSIDNARRAICERNPSVKSLELNGIFFAGNSLRPRELTAPSITSV